MEPEHPDVDELIDSIADGAPIEWPRLIASCRDEAERQLLEQLRILSEVGRATDVGVSNVAGAPASPAHAARQSLFTWGSLEVFEELGRGAFGRVFRARDPRLDREVALKLSGRTTIAEPSFLREAQLLARIRHPHVVAVYGADAFEETTGLWMELIRGQSLRTIVRQQGAFGPREAALIALDLCAALAAVHGTGLVHRDIKANNVMREVGGRIVLMDFGAGLRSTDAAVEDAGTTGTPLYMAPELFAGSDASVSTDLYALGVLLFFLVTGDYPVTGRSLAELRDAHVHGTRRWLREARPDVPATLAQVIDRAVNPNPAVRFRTAADMEQAIAATLDVHGRTTVADMSAGRGWRRFVSQPVPAWLTMIGVGLAVAATLWLRLEPLAPGQPSTSELDNAQVASGPKALTAAQWEVIDGHAELASSLAESGRWSQAAEHYEKVSSLLRGVGWQDEPYRAHVMAMIAWAQIHDGKLDDAASNLSLALYKLAQEGGVNHPLRATFEMASATERYARRDMDGAAEAIVRAIGIRRGAAAATGAAAAPARPLDLERLTQSLALHTPDRDADSDWIPDAIEEAVGLDPTRRDSDGNGTPDDEEDTNRDGLSNAREWGIVAAPTHVLAHFGAIDPERAGYRREREFQGRAVPSTEGRPPAWRVTAPRMGFYYQRLSETLKRGAMTRGWRLLSAGSLWTGNGVVDVDFTPHGSRFDEHFVIRDRASLVLLKTIMPLDGEWFELGPAGPWPPTELIYDPGSGARLVVGGRQLRTGYRGHQQFQENLGLFWGATNDVGAAPSGDAEYSLILLQIR